MFRARGGVVLAAGDFTNDPELKSRYLGAQEAKASGVNPTATGDGQKLALPLGARILNGDLALGPELRFVPPVRANLLQMLPPWPWLAAFMAWSLDHMPPALLRPFIMSFVTTALAPSPDLFEAGALLVNRNGERFTDERNGPALAVPDQPGGNAFILLDARIAAQFEAWPHFISTAPGVAYAYLADYRRNRGDVYVQAPTLEALAEKLDMPADTLVALSSLNNKPPATGRPSAPALMSRSGRPARSSCTTRAALRSMTNTASWAKPMRRSRASMPRARPGKAEYCSRVMDIIWRGLSPRAAAADALPRPTRRHGVNTLFHGCDHAR